MKKYKIKPKSGEELSDKEISKYKDFGGMMTNYNDHKTKMHQPLYKNPKFFLALLLILLVIYLLAETSRKDKEINLNHPTEIQKP